MINLVISTVAITSVFALVSYLLVVGSKEPKCVISSGIANSNRI